MANLRPDLKGPAKIGLPDNALEAELHSKQRIRPGHPSHTETNILTAAEERSRRRRMKNSKAKKYDGRARGQLKDGKKNGTASLPRVREALENFYKEVELPELKQALELSNDPKYQLLLAALNDPRFSNCSFSTLCRKCRMSLQDVVEIWRSHLQVKGIVKMMVHMPSVMEDVAIDSKSKMVTCNVCQGVGKLRGKEVNMKHDPICPECHGDGVVRLLGDKDARLLAFETVGLKKGAGITNIVNVDNRQGAPSMEDQIADVDKIFDVEYTDLTPKLEEEHGTGESDNHGNEAGPERPAATDTGSGADGVADASASINANKSLFDNDEISDDPTDYH